MSKRSKAKRRARYYRAKEDLQNPPCWCGVRNPLFHSPPPYGCGGMGYYDCLCGGDLCVCHNHGEIECFGCADCLDAWDHDYDRDDDPDYEIPCSATSIPPC